MEIGILGYAILLVSSVGSFMLGRWFSRRRRDTKAAERRAREEAAQSRQVRRARERRGKA